MHKYLQISEPDPFIINAHLRLLRRSWRQSRFCLTDTQMLQLPVGFHAHGTSSPILSLLVCASLHAKRVSCTQRIKQPPLTCGDKFHDPEWALLTTDSTGPSSPRAALHMWPQRLRRQTQRLQRRVSARLLPVSPCSEVSVPPGSQRLLPFPGQGIVTPLFLQTRSLAFPFLFSFCYCRLEEGKQTPRGGHVYEATHGDLGRTVLTPAFVTAEPCFFLMEKSQYVYPEQKNQTNTSYIQELSF